VLLLEYSNRWSFYTLNEHIREDGALTGLSIVCPAAGLVVGGIYFDGDITTQYYTGKSLTQNHFDE